MAGLITNHFWLIHQMEVCISIAGLFKLTLVQATTIIIVDTIINSITDVIRESPPGVL